MNCHICGKVATRMAAVRKVQYGFCGDHVKEAFETQRVLNATSDRRRTRYEQKAKQDERYRQTLRKFKRHQSCAYSGLR